MIIRGESAARPHRSAVRRTGQELVACVLEFGGGDAERGRGAVDVERGTLQQLGRDQAGARVAASVGVGVGAGQLAAGDVARVGVLVRIVSPAATRRRDAGWCPGASARYGAGGAVRGALDGGALALAGGVEVSVDGRAGNADEVSDLLDGVLAGVV